MEKSYANIYNFYIWKRRVDSSRFYVFNILDLPNSGFSSLYAVDESTANAIQESQNFSGFKGIVYSKYLTIDADTDEAVKSVERGLREKGLSFEKWETGNRGAHFRIVREALPTQDLPNADKMWVKANFPEADLKLYSHLHMFRRPGAIHQKTGKKKTLAYTVEGKTLVIEKGQVKPQVIYNPVDISESIFDDSLVMLWTTPQENGHRNQALVTIAYRMAEKRESPEFTLRWLEHTNALFKDPKPQEELEKIVRYAFLNKGAQ